MGEMCWLRSHDLERGSEPVIRDEFAFVLCYGDTVRHDELDCRIDKEWQHPVHTLLPSPSRCHDLPMAIKWYDISYVLSDMRSLSYDLRDMLCRWTSWSDHYDAAMRTDCCTLLGRIGVKSVRVRF
jgi:hypothetical protein